MTRQYPPRHFTIIYNDRNLYGIRVQSTERTTVLCGVQQHAQEFVLEDREFVHQIKIDAHNRTPPGGEGKAHIDQVMLASTDDTFTVTPPNRFEQQPASIELKAPEGKGWKLRGFYVSYVAASGIQQLGVIWGNEQDKNDLGDEDTEDVIF